MLLSILLRRSRVRGATIMLAGLVVGATLIVPVSPEAYAATGGDGCNPNSNGSRPDNYRHYYFVNAQDGPSISEGGIQADIFNYSPWVYRTDPGVTAWVALGDATTGSYGQIGWWESPGNVRYTFVQFWDEPGNHYWNNLDPPQGVNTTHNYEVLYDPGGNSGGKGQYFTFWVDRNGSNGYVTGSQYNWSPDFDQLGTEIHTRASQMPGGSSSPKHEVFSNTLYYNGGWVTGGANPHSRDGGTDGTGQGGGPSWDVVQATTGGFNSWDSACTN